MMGWLLMNVGEEQTFQRKRGISGVRKESENLG